MSLAKKAVNSAAWVVLSNTTMRVLRLVTTIILARILLPEDFGLVALALLGINALGLFRDLGIGSALIYHKKDIDKAANTAFILLPLVGLTLFIVSYVISPYLANFFNEEDLVDIIRVLAINFIITSFYIVPSMLLEKGLHFRKVFLIETIPVLIYAITTIYLALNGFGVWSLVYGQIISNLTTLMITSIVSPWRPSFKFDKEIGKEVISYGKYIMGVNIVGFLVENLDYGIIGKMLDATALGFYTIAYRIALLPATNITTLVSRVTFPVYSKLQDNNEKMVKAYLETMKNICFVSIPIAFGLFAIAPQFVIVVLGDRWLPSIPVLQVLSFLGMLWSIAGNTGSVYKSTGRPDILVKFDVVKVIIMVPVLLFSVRYGALGVAVGITTISFFTATINLLIANHLLRIKASQVIEILYPPIFSSLIMLLGVLGFQTIADFLGSSEIVNLAISMIVGVILYLVAVYFINKQTLFDIKGILELLLKRG